MVDLLLSEIKLREVNKFLQHLVLDAFSSRLRLFYQETVSRIGYKLRPVYLNPYTPSDYTTVDYKSPYFLSQVNIYIFLFSVYFLLSWHSFVDSHYFLALFYRRSLFLEMIGVVQLFARSYTCPQEIISASVVLVSSGKTVRLGLEFKHLLIPPWALS